MIAAESFSPGASPSDVARRHHIGTGLLYTWRRGLLAAQPGLAGHDFARVELTAGAAPRPPSHPAPASYGTAVGLTEIVLPDGTMLRIDPRIDVRALRRLLTVLRG